MPIITPSRQDFAEMSANQRTTRAFEELFNLADTNAASIAVFLTEDTQILQVAKQPQTITLTETLLHSDAPLNTTHRSSRNNIELINDELRVDRDGFYKITVSLALVNKALQVCKFWQWLKANDAIIRHSMGYHSLIPNDEKVWQYSSYVALYAGDIVNVEWSAASEYVVIEDSNNFLDIVVPPVTIAFEYIAGYRHSVSA